MPITRQPRAVARYTAGPPEPLPTSRTYASSSTWRRSANRSHSAAVIYAYNYQPGADGGITGPNGDQYLYAHTQLDAQASYTVHRQIQLVVALLNLNNEVFGFYQGSPQYPIQREFYNRTVSVGLRLTR
jgi:hypothetical protein